MSILHITNLTKNPERDIAQNYESARTWLQSENNLKITDTELNDFVDSEINNLEDIMNESKGSELLSIIDNYLVNHDYVDTLKNFIEDK
jgi:DNA-directed RNA polymerase specialized sigma subunit